LKQCSRVLHIIVSPGDLLAGPWVDVGSHLPDAVVRHLPGEVRVKLLLGDELSLGGDGPERRFDFLGTLNVLRLLGYHVGHVVLKLKGARLRCEDEIFYFISFF